MTPWTDISTPNEISTTVDPLLSPPLTVTPPPASVSSAPSSSRPQRPPNPFLLAGHPTVDQVQVLTEMTTTAAAATTTTATTTLAPTTTSSATITANQLFQATLPQERVQVQTQRPGRNRTTGAAAVGEPAPRRRRLANSAAVGQYLQVTHTKV